MQIERFYYREKKENELDTRSILKHFDSCCLSEAELEMGRAALQHALAMMDLFERSHPRIESPERIDLFEGVAQAVLEMSEILGMDVCVYIDENQTGHITLTGDSVLLRRDSGCNFLPLMKKLMDMCDEFYVDSVEKYGETLVCMSFTVPLYVRGISI